MYDFDLSQIAPHCGGKREAFEELCCQLASRTASDYNYINYIRLRGAGGDGGVECFADLANGTRIGWQAKYVFDTDSLIKQATCSLETALKIHTTLSHYVICFPFDVTGPTGRRNSQGEPAVSGQEKIKKWLKKWQDNANNIGRQLTIELWSESKLRSLIIDLDTSGGIREFFFNKTTLSSEWFQNHLQKVKTWAGSRYTPKLNVQTELWKWLSAFGRTNEWADNFEKKIKLCLKVNVQFTTEVTTDNINTKTAEYIVICHENINKLVPELLFLKDAISKSIGINHKEMYESICLKLKILLDCLVSLETYFLNNLKQKYGSAADSVGFRQWMAEINLSFPTFKLDCTRNTIDAYQALYDWLNSPEGFLAFSHVFILTGVAGSGKTHGICDAASYRYDNRLLTCVTFGHLFQGYPSPWTRILEIFGLPITLGMNGLLDVMNAAAETSGSLLILFIDAINETRPLNYWKDHLSSIIYEIQKRPSLRLCITCRTTFCSSSLPEKSTVPILEHQGFKGIEQNACTTFFQYYELEPPVSPILQPEFKNPLYLKLLCETLVINGLKKIPSGWSGISSIIRAFIVAKEKQFVEEYNESVSLGSNVIGNSLRAIVQALAISGDSALNWTQAISVINSRVQVTNLPILEWLVRADLLIEDAPTTSGDIFGSESSVRPSFERLGDFLVANEILSKIKEESQLTELFKVDGLLNYMIRNSTVVAQNNGIISALSIIIPEKFYGIELPNLIVAGLARDEIVQHTVLSFVWRDPKSLSENSKNLLHELLIGNGTSFKLAMNVVLSISCQSSVIDAMWLNSFLMQYTLPQRDAAWCGFLHQQYEAGNYVKQLIDAAFSIPLNQVELNVLQRWSITLLWFTSASDRRVKHNAARAASAILAVRSKIIPDVLSIFLHSNDDAVIECALLSSYGALIVSRDIHSLQLTILAIYKVLDKSPGRFDNALLRDHIRCLTELAQELKVIPNECDPKIFTSPINSGWPLQFPSDAEIQIWNDNDKFPKLVDSCLEDDFFIYSMSCLRHWEHSIDRETMGRWILQEVINNLGYSEFNCNLFDKYILSKYGGGRGRPSWAERIGKKYQWISLYRLVSKLSDYVEPKHDNWEPEFQRTPLFLLDQRQIDPTLPATVVKKKHNTDVWWIKPKIYPQSLEHFSDAEWVESQDDLPKMEDLLEVMKYDGQKWRLLSSYPAWGHRDRDNEDKPYRQIWIHLHSYLILEENFEELYSYLDKRNFYGQWMPEGSSWLYGFAGEYPWATSFNTKPDSWYAEGYYDLIDLSEFYNHSSNRINVEWGNDASLFQSFEMCLPSRIFFEKRDLWWNGNDGYRVINGKTVFRDPSVTQVGPHSLISDNSYLLDKLDNLGFKLMWTLLGEKWILGGNNLSEPRPRKTFSQIARLEKNGSVVFGERVFFKDYNQDTGLLINANKVDE